MKIGTLACKLFGHKFIEKVIRDDYNVDGEYFPNITFTYRFERSYCVRCGIKREEIK